MLRLIQQRLFLKKCMLYILVVTSSTVTMICHGKYARLQNALMNGTFEKPQPQLHTDIDRLRKGNVGAQFWSVYVPAETRKAGNAYQTTVEQIELVHDMIKRYPDVFQLALTADDVDAARKSGKIASLIGMEGGHSIEDSLQNLRRLFDMGARYMTLTHCRRWAGLTPRPNDSQHGGLAPFGEEVVREMNRLGMLVDLSHVSPETMHDALELSKPPVILSRLIRESDRESSSQCS